MALERRTTRLAALGAAIAMGGGLALAAAAPANAFEVPETAEIVGAADIRPDETTYVGWHNGAAGAYTDSAGGYGGLDLTGKVQILNGFDENAENGDLRELIEAGIQWGASNTYFQIPLFFDNVDGDQQYTTLRPAASNEYQVDLAAQWTTSKAIAGSAYAANATDTLENLLTAIEGANEATDDIILLGYGVFVDDGQNGNLYNIKWGTQLTNFGTPPAALPLGEAPFADSAELSDFVDNEYEGVIFDGGTLTQGTAGVLTADIGEAWGGAGAWAAFSYFDVYAYSAPVPVGVVQTDDTGVLTVPMSVETLAALAPGEHTLTISQQNSEGWVDAIVTFTVVAAPASGSGSTTTGAALAETGFDAALPLFGGALLLAAGAVLVLRRRASASA